MVLFVELLGRSDGIGYKIEFYYQMFNMSEVLAHALLFLFIMLFLEIVRARNARASPFPMASGAAPVVTGTDMTSAASIDVKQVSKSFAGKGKAGGWKALDGATFSVSPGEFVCILGPSGCGKSTLLNILSGLDDQYDGDASILGRPVDEQIANGVRIAYVFQEPRLMPWRTVRANIEFALRDRRLPRRRNGRSGSTAAWRWSSCRISATSTRCSCPAACSSAPRSRAPSPSSPRCC